MRQCVTSVMGTVCDTTSTVFIPMPKHIQCHPDRHEHGGHDERLKQDQLHALSVGLVVQSNIREQDQT